MNCDLLYIDTVDVDHDGDIPGAGDGPVHLCSPVQGPWAGSWCWCELVSALTPCTLAQAGHRGLGLMTGSVV